MTTDPFLAAIESAAQEAIARIEAETDQKVAVILRRAQGKVDEEIDRYIQESEQEARRKHQRDLNAARVKAQRAEADACYELYEDFFRSIAKDIIHYRDDCSCYQQVLCNLIRDAARGFQGGVIAVDPRDAACAAECASMLEHPFEVRGDLNSAGGCIVHNLDNTVIRDNTFETRMSRVRSEMEREIWSVLVS
jgi:vacuolar-type H+-ATPase subunit E/Vma4